MKLLRLWTMLALLCSGAMGQSDDKVKALIDRVAKGSPEESAEAAEELAEMFARPIAAAIGKLGDRPPEEVRRLRAAVRTVSAALNIRVFELDLPEEDRKLFRRFFEDNRELTYALFSPSASERGEALARVPLDRGSGSGIVIAARVDDEEEDVAFAALDVAAELRDAVVARRLRAYVKDATEAIRGGAFGPQDQGTARAVAMIVARCIRILTLAKDADAIPAQIDALTYFMKSPYWLPDECIESLRAVGETGDERAAAALLTFLDDARGEQARSLGVGRLVVQTLGDVSLLALLRIYGLEPEAFAFIKAGTERSEMYGYLDPRSRLEGRRAFLKWHEQNAALPREKRQKPASLPPASAPASAPTDADAAPTSRREPRP
jgi:hypothetical protein